MILIVIEPRRNNILWILSICAISSTKHGKKAGRIGQERSLIMLLKTVFRPSLKRSYSIHTKLQHMVAFSKATEGGLYFTIDW